MDYPNIILYNPFSTGKPDCCHSSMPPAMLYIESLGLPLRRIKQALKLRIPF